WGGGRRGVEAGTGTYGGHKMIASEVGDIPIAPVRIGARTIALLAAGGRALEPGTRDAIAGIVAIAIERLQFLDERHGAELTRHRAQLASALLASPSHDLRTPLTAIPTAATHLSPGA